MSQTREDRASARATARGDDPKVVQGLEVSGVLRPSSIRLTCVKHFLPITISIYNSNLIFFSVLQAALTGRELAELEKQTLDDEQEAAIDVEVGENILQEHQDEETAGRTEESFFVSTLMFNACFTDARRTLSAPRTKRERRTVNFFVQVKRKNIATCSADAKRLLNCC